MKKSALMEVIMVAGALNDRLFGVLWLSIKWLVGMFLVVDNCVMGGW